MNASSRGGDSGAAGAGMDCRAWGGSANGSATAATTTSCWHGECVAPPTTNASTAAAAAAWSCRCFAGYTYDEEIVRSPQCTLEEAAVTPFFAAYVAVALVVLLLLLRKAHHIMNLDFSNPDFAFRSLKRAWVHFVSPRRVLSKSATLSVRAAVSVACALALAGVTVQPAPPNSRRRCGVACSLLIATQYISDYLLGWILILTFFEPAKRLRHEGLGRIRFHLNIATTVGSVLSLGAGLAMAATSDLPITALNETAFNAAAVTALCIFSLGASVMLYTMAWHAGRLVGEAAKLTSKTEGPERSTLKFFLWKMKVAQVAGTIMGSILMGQLLYILSTWGLTGVAFYFWVVIRCLLSAHLALCIALLYFLTTKQHRFDPANSQWSFALLSSPRPGHKRVWCCCFVDASASSTTPPPGPGRAGLDDLDNNLGVGGGAGAGAVEVSPDYHRAASNPKFYRSETPNTTAHTGGGGGGGVEAPSAHNTSAFKSALNMGESGRAAAATAAAAHRKMSGSTLGAGLSAVASGAEESSSSRGPATPIDARARASPVRGGGSAHTKPHAMSGAAVSSTHSSKPTLGRPRQDSSQRFLMRLSKRIDRESTRGATPQATYATHYDAYVEDEGPDSLEEDPDL